MVTLRPGDEPKVQRAINALEDLSVVGTVEDFNQSLSNIAKAIKECFPNYEYQVAHSNKSKLFDFELSPALDQLLKECNKADHRLWVAAKQTIKRSST